MALHRVIYAGRPAVKRPARRSASAASGSSQFPACGPGGTDSTGQVAQDLPGRLEQRVTPWRQLHLVEGVVTFQSQPQSFCFTEEVVLVQQHSRQEIVELLRKAGLPDAADKAMAELPDPVSLEDAEQWGARHGITRDLLISQFGGSP